MRIVTVLLTALALAAASGAARGQVLDQTWFKIKVSGKAFLVDNETGEATKAKAKAAAYLYLEFTPPDPEEGAPEGGTPPSQSYDYVLWCDVDGVWMQTDTGELSLFGTDEHLFAADLYFDYIVSKTSYFGGYQSAEFKNKLDSEGNLKKSKYKVLGAELIEGTDTGAETAVGGYKASGSSVDPEKLPFDPKMVVEEAEATRSTSHVATADTP